MSCRPNPIRARWREQARTGPWGRATRDFHGRDQGTRRRCSWGSDESPQRSRDRDHPTSTPIDNVIALNSARRPAQQQLSLWTQPDAGDELATRLATAPGLVRPGAALWDDARTPIHPLSMESAYADPQLLRDLGARGARFARELGADVVVGAETAGVPLAASIALAAGLPFAFVRKPGYRGHEVDEPPVRGADVAGRRVLFVDDAVSSGSSVERFTASLVVRAPT